MPIRSHRPPSTANRSSKPPNAGWSSGISVDDQIDEVLRTGQPIRNITVHAPMAGFVTERKAFPNQKVTPDSDLYTITDLSRVWIMADVFESDITAIKVGDAAYVSFANASAPPLAARVNYIQPQVDPTTRTLQVRLDANNPGMRMKPDMFVNVEFGVVTTPQLTVPTDAVLDTGDRQTVFVDLGNGYLEPRQVVVGDRFGDQVAITRGLSAGERVVASGTFLVDSESQLKAAASGMGARCTAGVPPMGRRACRARHRRRSSGTAVINAIIEFSAKNRFIVFLLVAVAVVAGVWSMQTVPLDAIPDLSDTQVIVYSRWDRSPDIIEDQVTYPIVTAMLGAPKVKDGPRVLRLRLLVRLHRVRGRHGHLLGALAHDGVSVGRPAAAAARRPHRARTGRHRRRLGVPVRPRRYHRPSTASTSCAPTRTGTCGTT